MVEMLPAPVAKLELDLADCFQDLLSEPLQSPRDSIDTEFSIEELEDLAELEEFQQVQCTVDTDCTASACELEPPPKPRKRRRTNHAAWTDSELDAMDDLIEVHGLRWRALAECLPGRTEDAVRQAYSRRHAYRPKTRTGPTGPIGWRPHWTEKEDSLLRSGFLAYHKKWMTIKEEFGLRHSPSAIKGRAYRLGLV